MSTATETTALQAFRAADFDWATRLQDVWSDPAYDVPELHANIRHEVAGKLADMRQAVGVENARSPLGWVLVGEGGSGKTHLLGALRREAVRQGAAFVLVDMTDVRDFEDTLLQGYLGSLQVEYADERYQYETLLWNFIQCVGPNEDAGRVLQTLATRKSSRLADDVQSVLKALRRRYGMGPALEFQDVVRALICLNSDDFKIATTGMKWLQSQELEEEESKQLGFQKRREPPKQIVEALSWLMSLNGPTILAFDQLDPIVYQHSRCGDEPSDERDVSWQIIQGIGRGLMSFPDSLRNTLPVLSCIEVTWNLLCERVLQTATDRYEIRPLQRPNSATLHAALITNRLTPAYQKHGFDPPYPTWPFSASAIEKLTNESFREVLKMCDAHRRRCLEVGEINELTEFRVTPRDSSSDTDSKKFRELDKRMESYAREVRPADLLEEKQDDERLAPLYQTALQCLIHEHEDEIPQSVDAFVEQEFAGGKSTKPLHARLRFVFLKENSREQHFCVRALQRSHASAYQTRLKAAMTQSGIDKALKFRHLTVIRSAKTPGGAVTQKLTKQFRDAGGQFHKPSEQELRTLAALRRLAEEQAPEFQSWLQERKPVTKLDLQHVLAPGCLFGNGKSPSTAEIPKKASRKEPPLEDSRRITNGDGPPEKESQQNGKGKQELGGKSSSKGSGPSDSGQNLLLGQKLLGLGKLGETISIPLSLLKKHTMILGGSGSGKSVTVRRLVEEAVLSGIPSIIVDCAQDMACFDERWPEPHEHWMEGDIQRAERFHETAVQIVWTPGAISDGNPLCLRPLPDFTSLKDDPEELQDAVMMVCDALQSVVARGNSQKSEHKKGVLVNSLKFFAKHFPAQGLEGYISLLADLPQEAELGISNEKKLAAEMANSLKVEQAKNPLLAGEGTLLDPLVLFGDDAPRDSVRLSVISLVKLKGETAPHAFLNQLATQLFSWIKQNPTPPNGRVLRGLLVIDEARDFVPSQKSTMCKESMNRLAAQARKYGLGLVFATQHPKDVETKIVGNCATHYYGLNNSPTSLATLQDLMSQKGGSGDDIPKLQKGQFYIHNADAGHDAPIKIKVPMSLSFSPKNPLEESKIMEKARRSRRLLDGTN